MVNDPLDGLVPKCPLMQTAWRDCLLWAIGESQIVKNFKSETGSKFTPDRKMFYIIIDKPNGKEADFVRKFVEWFNENVWGDINESV